MKLEKSQLNKLKDIMNDPVKWAQTFLRSYNASAKKIDSWKARWYQASMLRDKSTRKVYRCGRRIGKCLPGYVKILNPKTGERITVEELYKKGKAHIVTMTDDYKLQEHFTNQILDNGIKEVYRVTTKTGRHIDATINHPLFTALGWQPIQDLKIGDKVAIANNLSFFGKRYVNEKEIKLLAYMIGDGNYSSNVIRFCNSSQKIVDELREAVEYFDCELVQYKSNRNIDYNIIKKYNKNDKTYPNKVKELLIKHDMFGKTGPYKTIPKDIFKINKKKTALFLSRLYATDGWAFTRKDGKSQIGYCSASRELVEDIQHLLLKFGINSYINTKKAKYNGDIKISYHLLITKSLDIIKFCNSIGIYSKEDDVKKAYDAACSYKKYDRFLPKEILTFVEEDRIKQNILKKDLYKSNKDYNFKYNIQRNTLKEYAKILNNKDLENFSQGEFLFDEIVSIESLGKMQTYDLSVPLTMNFVANDFITHNTETMVVEMLHMACTNKHFKILMIAPYENQVQNMFTRLNEIIEESPLVKEMVISTKKNPAKIMFSNGSSILGFTTGDTASSIRGQSADWLFFDEIDFMSTYCYEVCASIAMERPEIGITASSTPLGKRTHFYHMCTNKSWGYSEHYHPSTHNPGWNSEMEAELKAQLTAEAYIHEVLAEFGTQQTGVFNKDKIDIARQVINYAYNELDFFQLQKIENENLQHPLMLQYDKQLKAPANKFRTMGVDWDKYEASSSILILEYSQDLDKFMVLKRVEIPRSQYSYDTAVNLIIELNEIYNPSFIYCDAGSGEYNLLFNSFIIRYNKENLYIISSPLYLVINKE